MLKVYDIETPYSYSSQTHSVVAQSIGEAERIFQHHYPYTKIEKITLHSDYVLTAETERMEAGE